MRHDLGSLEIVYSVSAQVNRRLLSVSVAIAARPNGYLLMKHQAIDLDSDVEETCDGDVVDIQGLGVTFVDHRAYLSPQARRASLL